MNTKPFDLEAAKNGAEVCTREGQDARIICTDARIVGIDNLDYPILALVGTSFGRERVEAYTKDGKASGGRKHDDLIMKPTKRKGWVNVYDNGQGKKFVGTHIFESEEMASECGLVDERIYVDTTEIEWEE